MAAIDFPNSPTVGQTFTVGIRTWQWSGTAWDIQKMQYGNIDGGKANTIYGGIVSLNGGSAGSF